MQAKFSKFDMALFLNLRFRKTSENILHICGGKISKFGWKIQRIFFEGEISFENLRHFLPFSRKDNKNVFCKAKNSKFPGRSPSPIGGSGQLKRI